MQFEGVLTKMNSELAQPVQYYLFLGQDFININQILGKLITIQHKGFCCLNCNLQKKIFRQGFCYECFYASAQTGDWIMRPELSKAHLDIEDRDLEYEKKIQLQPHVVYLALSSEVKIGVTRKSQIPTRWIDQGAVQALPIVELPNRYLAGITEVALKEIFADKTNFRKMLQGEIPEVNLREERLKIRSYLPEEILPYFDTQSFDIYEINYPIKDYPIKIQSLNLDKTPLYRGVLKGIKGQYLIFEDNTVFNVRSNEGYVVSLTV